VLYQVSPETVKQVPDLAGQIVVAFCNGHLPSYASILRDMGCRIVWVNCMTFVTAREAEYCRAHGPYDAYVFQSYYQRQRLVPKLTEWGYRPLQGHLIRGAFWWPTWPWQPRKPTEEFVVGQMARSHPSKWSMVLWRTYERISYRPLKALVMGVNDEVLRKIGAPPSWATCLGPCAMPSQEFLRQLDCFVPINGGAEENWPRVGLECMASGVPIVTVARWGWLEMIQHGVTGFLAQSFDEIAHYATMLARNHDLRYQIAQAARRHLENELACPETIWRQWRQLFEVGLSCK
jgi:hypothetical protein